MQRIRKRLKLLFARRLLRKSKKAEQDDSIVSIINSSEFRQVVKRKNLIY